MVADDPCTGPVVLDRKGAGSDVTAEKEIDTMEIFDAALFFDSGTSADMKGARSSLSMDSYLMFTHDGLTVDIVAHDSFSDVSYVQGQVVDLYGAPVEGLVVTVEFARGSVVTDDLGQFSLEIPRPEMSHSLLIAQDDSVFRCTLPSRMAVGQGPV